MRLSVGSLLLCKKVTFKLLTTKNAWGVESSFRISQRKYTHSEEYSMRLKKKNHESIAVPAGRDSLNSEIVGIVPYHAKITLCPNALQSTWV